jgi:hypothetical protein
MSNPTTPDEIAAHEAWIAGLLKKAACQDMVHTNHPWTEELDLQIEERNG